MGGEIRQCDVSLSCLRHRLHTDTRRHMLEVVCVQKCCPKKERAASNALAVLHTAIRHCERETSHIGKPQ